MVAPRCRKSLWAWVMADLKCSGERPDVSRRLRASTAYRPTPTPVQGCSLSSDQAACHVSIRTTKLSARIRDNEPSHSLGVQVVLSERTKIPIVNDPPTAIGSTQRLMMSDRRPGNHSNASQARNGIASHAPRVWASMTAATPSTIPASRSGRHSLGNEIGVVTTRASYRRRVRRERFEWPPEDCIPGSPWTGGSLRFGNRLRRTFGCGSTRRLSA